MTNCVVNFFFLCCAFIGSLWFIKKKLTCFFSLDIRSMYNHQLFWTASMWMCVSEWTPFLTSNAFHIKGNKVPNPSRFLGTAVESDCGFCLKSFFFSRIVSFYEPIYCEIPSRVNVVLKKRSIKWNITFLNWLLPFELQKNCEFDTRIQFYRILYLQISKARCSFLMCLYEEEKNTVVGTASSDLRSFKVEEWKKKQTLRDDFTM